MATKTDRNGKITNYKYDIHARLLSRTIDKEEVSYSYDPNGNQLAMTDTTGTTTRIYDELGRVISKSVPNLGATTFQYDILVNSNTVPELTTDYTIPEGSTAEKSKDPKGNETTKVSDGAGRLIYVISEGKVTSYTYDANGNRASVVYPDKKTKETYEYYNDNQLKKLINTRADGSVMDEYSYTYDAAHNQTSKTEIINGTLKGTTNYTYDSLNRLTEVTEPKKTTETSGKLTKYTYDAAGNRETEQVTTSTAAGTQVTLNTYKYNEQNRLLSTTEETGDGTKKTTTYSYDPNGNMTKKSFEQTRQIDPSNPPTPKFGMYIEGQQDGATENAKPIAAGTASYEFDVWNQLIKASTGEGTSTYKYNGEGYRTEKTENGVLTRSLYEADKVILETDKNGKETARNIYGTNLISRTVTTTENGTTQKDQYNYMYNGHADVTALLTADGTIVASYYYDAFGTAIEKNENKGINNPYRYSGYVFDNATSLYYLNARYYDSKIARFMSEDTYTGTASDPLSLNLYTYCVNNPIMYTDPSGHHTEWDESHLTPAELKIVDDAGTAYGIAKAANDVKGMAEAHQTAENVRNRYRENGEHGTADGHTVVDVYPSPSNKITIIASNDGQNTKKDTNKVSTETIVVSGSEYQEWYQDVPVVGDYLPGGRFKYTFIEPAIKKLIDIRKNNVNINNQITWLISSLGYSKTDIANMEDTAKKLGVKLVWIDNKDQFINYINSGSVNNKTENRDERKISSMTFFSHGLDGVLALGYNQEDEKDIDISLKDLSKIQSDSFTKDISTVFYSCNAGTNINGKSFAQEWVNRTGGTAVGAIGRTDYVPTIGDWSKNEKIIKKRRSEKGYMDEGSFEYPGLGNNASWKKFTKQK